MSQPQERTAGAPRRGVLLHRHTPRTSRRTSPRWASWPSPHLRWPRSSPASWRSVAGAGDPGPGRGGHRRVRLEPGRLLHRRAVHVRQPARRASSPVPCGCTGRAGTPTCWSRGSEHARRSGWAWGGWVTPVVALWFPFQVVRDVRQAVSPHSTVGAHWVVVGPVPRHGGARVAIAAPPGRCPGPVPGRRHCPWTLDHRSGGHDRRAGRMGQVLRAVTTEQHGRMYGAGQ